MTPTEDELAVFTAKLSANARVNLYDKNYLYRLKWTFPLLLVTLLVTISSCFYFGIVSQSQLILSSSVAFLLLFAVHFISRHARVASLKGDTLILRGIDSKSTVTSIRSVRKAHSFRILGVQITRLRYTLDQQTRYSLVFGAPIGMTISLDELLSHAKRCKK